MGLFSMLESFFFVTLGISCILLIMLIYHFKQRINKLENNNRMMFDVINNMVQELSILKNTVQYNAQSNPPTGIPSQFNYPEEEYTKLDVSLNEKDDEEYESESESAEWESAEGSDLDTEASVYSEDKDLADTIKTVAVELEDGIDNTVIDSDELSNEELLDKMDEIVSGVELDTDETNMIQVNKLEESSNLEESSVDTQSIDKKSVYKKMTVTSLKALVIEKGLNTDPSKLKKTELLQILENN